MRGVSGMLEIPQRHNPLLPVKQAYGKQGQQWPHRVKKTHIYKVGSGPTQLCVPSLSLLLSSDIINA